MYYVYFLKSIHHEQVYIGLTSDLKRRLSEHNQGKSIHTNKFKPWAVTTYLAFGDKNKAEAFERYAKTGSGIAFARKHLL
jgi:predicted GIY-YIG superfamily endonuclease